MRKIRSITLLSTMIISINYGLADTITPELTVNPSATIDKNATPAINFVEINPDAYYHNLVEIQKMVGPQVKICAVMKSNAYGHGIDNLIGMALKAKIDYIAAVDNSEFKLLAGKEQITWDEFASRNKMGITEQILLIGNQTPHILIK